MKQNLRIRSFLLGWFLCLVSLQYAQAKEINFEVSVSENKVAVGKAITLSLTFNGTQQVPALDVPVMDGLEVQYRGPSTSMSIINGKVSSSITHIYSLLGTKVGSFTIGPLRFEHNQDTYTSNQVHVEVVDEPVRQAGQSQVQVDDTQSQPADLSDRIFVLLDTDKKSVYVNEVFPVRVKMFVNKLGIRDIQFPQVGHEGFSLEQFVQPKQYQQEISGVTYDVIEFETNAYALKTGELTLGPVKLSCNLIVKKQSRRRASEDDFFGSDIFDDFFGKFESYPLNLSSPELKIEAKNLPVENKPTGFNGAIGEFVVDASVSPDHVNVGDPITVRATVEGTGNLNSVTFPALSSNEQIKVYEPQVHMESGKKVFEQVIMPLSQSLTHIPALEFSFFNPKINEYQQVSKGPFAITVLQSNQDNQNVKIVEKTNLKTLAPTEEKLGVDIVFIKPDFGESIPVKPLVPEWMWFMQLIPALFYLIFWLVVSYWNKLKNDTRLLRKVHAPKKAQNGIQKAARLLSNNKDQEFFDVIFQTLQEYIGDRLHIPGAAVTIGVVEERLYSAGVNQETVLGIQNIFKECDAARYALQQFSRQDKEALLRQLKEVILKLQKAPL